MHVYSVFFFLWTRNRTSVSLIFFRCHTLINVIFINLKHVVGNTTHWSNNTRTSTQTIRTQFVKTYHRMDVAKNCKKKTNIWIYRLIFVNMHCILNRVTVCNGRILLLPFFLHLIILYVFFTTSRRLETISRCPHYCAVTFPPFQMNYTNAKRVRYSYRAFAWWKLFDLVKYWCATKYQQPK